MAGAIEDLRPKRPSPLATEPGSLVFLSAADSRDLGYSWRRQYLLWYARSRRNWSAL
jgi:hypothetical protein